MIEMFFTAAIILLLISAAGCFVLSFVVICISAVAWLKDGIWPQDTTRTVFEAASIQIQPIQWKGVEILTQYFLNTPLSVGFIIVGVAFLILAGLSIYAADECRRLRR